MNKIHKIKWTPNTWGLAKMEKDFQVLVELLNSKNLTKEEVKKVEEAFNNIEHQCESLMEIAYDYD